MSDSPADPEHERICEALFQGRKIEAIKIYRGLAGVGLKEAKDFVDALEARLKRDQPERFKKPAGASGCAGIWVLIAGIAVLAALFWWLR
jgi:ribosomal protein L7/L12